MPAPEPLVQDSDYVQPERDIWQNPQLIIDRLGDLRGKTVADLGAGTGYFSFKLIENAEKVIAIDIDERFINFINNKLRNLPKDIQLRFEARLGEANNPHLGKEEVDAILVVNTYIYIRNRISYFTKLKQSIKPNGKIAVVDFKELQMPVGPAKQIKVPGYIVVEELKKAGYKNIVLDNSSLDYQYIIIAEK